LEQDLPDTTSSWWHDLHARVVKLLVWTARGVHTPTGEKGCKDSRRTATMLCMQLAQRMHSISVWQRRGAAMLYRRTYRVPSHTGCGGGCCAGCCSD
jgi:hypothetical protein